MKGQGTLKISVILALITAYLISFSYYGANVYGKVFNMAAGFDEGTAIGPVGVANKTKLDAAELVNKEIDKWAKNKKLILQYVEKSVPLDLSLFRFSVKASVNEAVSGEQNLLAVHVVKEQVKEEILLEFPELERAAFDFDALYSDLQDIAAYLQPGESVIDLTNYLNDESKQAVVSEAFVAASSADEALQPLMEEQPALTFKPKQVFSFNEWIDEAGYADLNEEALNTLSSLLYQIVLKTNFLILEKNQSTKLPAYMELGYEARVDREKDQDFIFMNNNPLPYTLQWKTVNGKLYGALKGVPFSYTYQAIIKNKQTYAPKTILHFTPALPYGQTAVKKTGEKGVSVEVYRERIGSLGKRKTERIAEDFYPPIHRIELHSSQEPPPKDEASGQTEEKQEEAVPAPKTDQQPAGSQKGRSQPAGFENQSKQAADEEKAKPEQR
ncbi:VanW family protein [Bacillus xiapuensis]|uniref:VanW family protein n=1 Tax=Bacillus xiapuensis TaxID=2014075 RepID=UPI000C230B19|nr:VanW family protein [Bacillus xiapuensis]